MKLDFCSKSVLVQIIKLNTVYVYIYVTRVSFYYYLACVNIIETSDTHSPPAICFQDGILKMGLHEDKAKIIAAAFFCLGRGKVQLLKFCRGWRIFRLIWQFSEQVVAEKFLSYNEARKFVFDGSFFSLNLVQ